MTAADRRVQVSKSFQVIASHEGKELWDKTYEFCYAYAKNHPSVSESLLLTMIGINYQGGLSSEVG